MTTPTMTSGVIYYRRVKDAIEMRLPYEWAYLGSFLGGARRDWDATRRVTITDPIGLQIITERAAPLGIQLVDVTGVKEQLFERVRRG